MKKLLKEWLLLQGEYTITKYYKYKTINKTNFFKLTRRVVGNDNYFKGVDYLIMIFNLFGLEVKGWGE